MFTTILGAGLPMIAAPMAGGLGFLAAGYKTPQALADEIAAVTAAAVPYRGQSLHPQPVPVDVAEFPRYADLVPVGAE